MKTDLNHYAATIKGEHAMMRTRAFALWLCLLFLYFLLIPTTAETVSAPPSADTALSAAYDQGSLVGIAEAGSPLRRNQP